MCLLEPKNGTQVGLGSLLLSCWAGLQLLGKSCEELCEKFYVQGCFLLIRDLCAGQKASNQGTEKSKCSRFVVACALARAASHDLPLWRQAFANGGTRIVRE